MLLRYEEAKANGRILNGEEFAEYNIIIEHLRKWHLPPLIADIRQILADFQVRIDSDGLAINADGSLPVESHKRKIGPDEVLRELDPAAEPLRPSFRLSS